MVISRVIMSDAVRWNFVFHGIEGERVSVTNLVLQIRFDRLLLQPSRDCQT